jgi:membrane-associated protease RseP (regulator of RpoE activity)
MKFYYYDIIFLIAFVLFLIIFFFARRKNWKWEKPYFLYRTKLGLEAIDWLAKKHPKTLKVISFFSIGFGYLLMAGMLYMLGQIVYIFVSRPEIISAAKIPPLMPLIPYLPEIFKINYLPPFYFTYWILAIAIIAVSHEFAHGVFARLNKIRVKSTGFGFLGPFLAAFVEPDEKQIEKKSIYAQLSVLTAGSFSNLLMTIIFFIIMALFFFAAFAPSGALFNAYMPGVISISSINQIDGINITGLSNQQIISSISSAKTFNSGFVDNLTRIKTANSSYLIPKEFLLNYYNSSDYTDAVVFIDAPAINVGLRGAITEINNKKIRSYMDIGDKIKKYSPGDKAIIKTEYNGLQEEYEIVFSADPQNSSKPFLGIGIYSVSGKGIIGKVVSVAKFFRNPTTYYKPRFDGNFAEFIDNLLWWIVVINISVALFNMLPVAFFDGGRVFYLTILAITKSENASKKIFAAASYAIVLVFVFLMILWAFRLF